MDETVSASCQMVDFGISGVETLGSAITELFSGLLCSSFLLLLSSTDNFFFSFILLLSPFNFQFTSTLFPLQLRYYQWYDSSVLEMRVLCYVLSYIAYLFALHFLSL